MRPQRRMANHIMSQYVGIQQVHRAPPLKSLALLIQLLEEFSPVRITRVSAESGPSLGKCFFLPIKQDALRRFDLNELDVSRNSGQAFFYSGQRFFARHAFNLTTGQDGNAGAPRLARLFGDNDGELHKSASIRSSRVFAL